VQADLDRRQRDVDDREVEDDEELRSAADDEQQRRPRAPRPRRLDRLGRSLEGRAHRPSSESLRPGSIPAARGLLDRVALG
jgi:hypothetical protein